MAKTKIKTSYACSACGAISSKWSGKCDECGQWDTIEEEKSAKQFTKTNPAASGTILEFSSLSGNADREPRTSTGIEELDRVLGGGLVVGSATLIGGDPGIGKSTLLLQLMGKMADNGLSCAYITGEESIQQVRLRARRLGLEKSPVKLAAATSVGDILRTLKDTKPDVVVIDSIQTMFVEGIESAPGTVSQVRMAAFELINLTKQLDTALLLVGHVTKDGQIAGPRVLEHMVDTVLYFEGDRGLQFRILRAVKNRFGAANEIGVFEMGYKGLKEVTNPSSLFISGKSDDVSGSVIFAGMEGTRPILVEIQALVSPSTMPQPRRAVVGWDNNRLAMILAVLQTRTGAKLADKEVYLNVAGGIKIHEPAADLAVAAALLSSLTNVPIPSHRVIIGEIGLSGEIRPVSQSDSRLKEAQKLGFTSSVLPEGAQKTSSSFACQEIRYINQLQSLLT